MGNETKGGELLSSCCFLGVCDGSFQCLGVFLIFSVGSVWFPCGSVVLPVDQASPQLLWKLIFLYLAVTLVWVTQLTGHSDSFSRDCQVTFSVIPSFYFLSLWGLLSLFCPI